MKNAFRAFGLAPLFALAGSLATAQEPLQIRISTVAPESEPAVVALRAFGAAVEKANPGKIQVKVFPGGSLFRQGTEVTAIQRGQLEMATPLYFEIEQTMPEYGVFSAPYAFRDSKHLMKVMRGPIGKEYYAEMEKRMGLVAFDVGYIGTRQINLRKARPVRTPADWAGLKLRVQPGGRAAISIGKGLGFTPVPMPVTEIYLSLKTGTVDAIDSPLPITRAAKVDEIIEQVTLTAHLVQPFVFVLGKQAWDKMDAGQKTSVRQAAVDAMEQLYKETVSEEASLAKEFEKKGIKFVTPDREAFRAAMTKQLTEDGLTAKWKPGLAEAIAAVK